MSSQNLTMAGVAVGAAAAGFMVAKSMYTPKKVVDTGLKEYSVIYTDRAVNLLSEPFKKVMRDISSTMKEVYNAHSVALIPGSGSYAMEAVARQFATDKQVMVLRNGYFSFRWTDIFEVGGFVADSTVLKAGPIESVAQPSFAPIALDEAVAKILELRPAVVFAPHVETSTGIILPDDYLKGIAAACRKVGALFVLDCIASGNIWVDMKACGVDIIVSAPQKGWTGPACCGIVMMSERARSVVLDPAAQPTTASFCCNLRQWTIVMDEYDAGRCKYYTTLPTDSLTQFRDVILETKQFGFGLCRSRMQELGSGIRAALEKRGFKSVAAAGFKAPGVVVSFSDIPGMVGAFKAQGLQIAGGVPFKLGEEKILDARKVTFRLGLFGLDKLQNVQGTIRTFERALDSIIASSKSKL